MRIAQKTCFSLLAALAISLATTSSFAQPADDQSTDSNEALEKAREHYQLAIELYQAGDYEQALVEFERAYKLSPNYRVLFNIGQTAITLRNYPLALRSFEQYLEDGGNNVPKDRQENVKSDIESLKRRVARIDVNVNEEGSEVLIDGEVTGVTPLEEPLMVNAGRHTILVRKRGWIEQRRSVTLAGAEIVNLTIELEEATSDSPVPLVWPPGGDRPTEEEKASYLWVPWTITGVLATGTAVAGIGAVIAHSDLEDLQVTQGVTPDELDSQASTAQGFAVATDVLLGATIISAGVALYFTVDELTETDEGEEGAEDEAEEEEEVGRTLQVRAGPTGMSISGTF